MTEALAAAEVTRTWHGGPEDGHSASDDAADGSDGDAGESVAEGATAILESTSPEDAEVAVDDAESPADAAEPSGEGVPTSATVDGPDDGDAAAAEPADEGSAGPDGASAEDAATSDGSATPTDEAREADADASDGERGIAVIPIGAVATATSSVRKKRTLRVARDAPGADVPTVLSIDGLVKRFGDTTAVDAISLDIRAGSFYGIVGPNGAGKTTTLSMITGLLRPDGGSVHVHGIDVWKEPRAAKRITGVLPDRLRLFDRLTGAELMYYSGSLRGLDHRTVLERSADLAEAFGLEDALDRLVADYSAGMTKKVALACAMIHSPRVLVLDEPFESVDPVSAANLTDILERYVAGGGTVLLSSHGMDLIERVCDSAAIIVGGRVLASGTLDEVRRGDTLEERFVELAGGRKAAEGMEWLHSFSD
ncbi:hypothetical protein GCM10009819_09240 [Agromyces tropicus]|uniref:ABC transporter domain-containing protein n=1 Tax=Agromyces tropicus TaxID=555371 RepID=A0ABN2U4A9_9MICO